MGRRLRIVSGLVLFAFVATHLLNVALGLHSIAMMDRARPYFMAVWSNPAGSLLLFLSFMAHLGLGLAAIYRRNTLRMTTTDTVQLVASLAIVPLLTPHVVGTALAARYGIEPTFASLIPYFWIDVPLEGLRQVLLLTFLWVHGCVGVFTWLRIQPWWTRVSGAIYPLAVAIPIVALLGFVEAGNDAIALRENPAAAAQAAAPPVGEAETDPGPQLPFDEILAILKRVNWTVFYVYAAVLGLTFAARGLRLSRHSATARVSFADGPTIEGDADLTVLEMAHLHHVAIAHLCRGRGRCGTCRVRVIDTQGRLPEPEAMERETLERVGAAPGMRLACQLRPPPGETRLERVLPPYLRSRDMHEAPAATPEAAPVAEAGAS